MDVAMATVTLTGENFEAVVFSDTFGNVYQAARPLDGQE